MKKRLVIFDLDGTLTNTSLDICDNVNLALRKFGYPEITVEEAKLFVGNGARKLIERALKGAPCDRFEELLDFYNRSYNFCGSPKTYVYPGMKKVISDLKEKGYLVAVISNKPQDGTTEVIRKFFGDDCFDYAFGQREGIKVKPDRACVDFVLKELSVKAEEAIFVGDSDVDAMTAINAGVDGIAVLWGYRPKQMLVDLGVKRFADTAEELEEIILSL